MKVSRGKQFEEQIRQAFEKLPETSILRLYDNMGGYINVSNVCDFIAYHYPNQYLIECKSIHGGTLNFKSDIRPNQWEGLLELSKIPGIVAGFMVWFVDFDVTVFVPIQEMEKLKQNGDKSLSFHKLPYNHITLKGKKRRVLFDYDLIGFIEETSKN